MSFVKCTDPEGFTVQLAQYEGVYVPPSPGVIQRMEQLATMPGRDNDVLILAYPKSGTHWVWTITQMLKQNTTELIVEEKTVDFLEFVDRDVIDIKMSPRTLNTHVRPRHLPADMLKRKCKIIFIQRNPKDIFVSFFNFCKNFSKFFFYEGRFSGFFELMMKGEMESGSWFDYMLEFEEFFKKHPDIPVLRLHYEDLKENLVDNVRKISEFCEFHVSDETIRGIADASTFNSMKKFKVDNVTTRLKHMWRDGNYGMYRKEEEDDKENDLMVLAPGPVPRASLRQIFKDDFNSLDRNHWEISASAAQGGHNEFQIYSPEAHNCYARGGVLHLRPTLTSDKFGADFLYHGVLDVKKQWGSCNPTWNNGCYRNAAHDGIMPPIMSCYMMSKMSFKYGKMEIVAKMPKGDWLWPALWLMPRHSKYGGWPKSGEIDVAELLGNTNYGSMGIQRTTASLHFGNDANHDKHVTNQHHLQGTSYGDNFHKYTLDWTPSHINIYIDDTLILGTPMPSNGFHNHYNIPGNNIWGSTHNAPFDSDFYIIMNVAVGGTGGIFPDGVKSNNHDKPWHNHESSRVAMQNFWNHKNEWYSTWHGESASMQVNSVTVWTY